MQQQLFNSANQSYQSISAFIKEKNYEQALLQIQDTEKSHDFLAFLIATCTSIQQKEDEEYEHWIHIFAVATSEDICDQTALQVLAQLLNHMIACTSTKFSIIIVKSILQRLEGNAFGKFILGSYFHLFASLLSDPTVADLSDIFREFAKAKGELKSNQSEFGHPSGQIDRGQLYCRSLVQFLSNIQKLPNKVNSKFAKEVVELTTSVLKHLFQSLQTDNKMENTLNVNISQLARQIPLMILSRLSCDIQVLKPTIIFANAFRLEYISGRDEFASSFYSKTWYILLLMRTINNELLLDLTAPAKLIRIEEEFMCDALTFLCREFASMSEEVNEFLASHYGELEEFLEKIHIYMGSINPQDLLYKNIVKVFVNLPFLTLEAREHLYEKLISKHSNYSFKVHLITQYRQLLNPACSRTVWIRSSSLLSRELKQLQPNTSIDYIGHIISFAFFWKELLKRFLKQPLFTLQCSLNIPQTNRDFQQSLRKLKQGLEVRVQISQSQNNEMQRNQATLCIFRITELIEVPDKI